VPIAALDATVLAIVFIGANRLSARSSALMIRAAAAPERSDVRETRGWHIVALRC